MCCILEKSGGVKYEDHRTGPSNAQRLGKEGKEKSKGEGSDLSAVKSDDNTNTK